MKKVLTLGIAGLIIAATAACGGGSSGGSAGHSAAYNRGYQEAQRFADPEMVSLQACKLMSITEAMESDGNEDEYVKGCMDAVEQAQHSSGDHSSLPGRGH